MEPATRIRIEKLIVHKVDHRNFNAPQLSDLESPVTDEVELFLVQHIVSNREDRRARMAQFNQPTDGQFSVRTYCDECLAEPERFVEVSRLLAGHLFGTMRHSRRIDPGDLVVCVFVEDTLRWLAFLKLDPKDGFVGQREQVDGHTRVVLHRVPGVFPTGALQKCAFVLPSGLRAERGYDLIVLDWQAGRYGADQSVASFFQTEFLQCKTGLNAGEITRSFVYRSRDWVSRKSQLWPPEDVARFNRLTIESIEGHTVDVVAFAQEAIRNVEEQTEYVEHMRRHGLEELTFEPEPAERENWTRFVWFKGDNDLRVRIRADAVGEGRTLNPTYDEHTNTHTIVIVTTNWTPELRRGT